MITDTEILDWMEDQLQKRKYTGKCIFRWSKNGRGFRLHETSLDGGVPNIREAITNAMTYEALNEQSCQSQKNKMSIRRNNGEFMMIVKPSNQERATWPDATRVYVEGIELRNKDLIKECFETYTFNHIKDCPWCGMLPEIIETSGGEFVLSCIDRDCVVQLSIKQRTKLKAILAWNRRNHSLEFTADHCDYYEQELIPKLKAQITNNLRLAENWSADHASLCGELSNIETLRELVRTYFEVNEIGCECCTVSNCGECMVCLILAYFIEEKNVKEQKK